MQRTWYIVLMWYSEDKIISKIEFSLLRLLIILLKGKGTQFSMQLFIILVLSTDEPQWFRLYDLA
jgi:hypothetical protein